MQKTIVLFLFPLLIFSQNIILEDIDLKNGDIKLPGTVTYPKSEKKIPLAIFIHGSGNVDKNGNQAGTPLQAKYIKTLADSLNAHGMAFYRYDKRTATPYNMEFLKNVTINDFAADAKAAIDYFKDDVRFGSIHLIGHSQGSLVAMLAITGEVDSYISIAGAGQTIDKTIIGQVKKQSLEMGEVAERHIQELVETDTIVSVNPFLLGLFAPQNQKFLKHWIAIDPVEEIKKISIPILILNGDADIQVSPSDAENLHNAQPNSTFKIIPKMNHVLKEVNSLEENQKSYSDPTFPISVRLVEQITSFINGID